MNFFLSNFELFVVGFSSVQLVYKVAVEGSEMSFSVITQTFLGKLLSLIRFDGKLILSFRRIKPHLVCFGEQFLEEGTTIDGLASRWLYWQKCFQEQT